MANTINIAAYKFAPLHDLRAMRTQLLLVCNAESLHGTILLSPEGINLFMAGARSGVERLLAELRGIDGLADLTPKYSESDGPPFHRLLVRIKKEIIAFGVEGINPSRHTSRKISPQVLKQWLDEGRPLTLLDTRNDYEVKLGTFKNALPAGIDHFRQFPEAVNRLPAALKEQPVVMFCTGGIRCEKAGPFMEREGFREVLQLEGGILKYFEECGGAHYDGECFVFDQRVGVDPALRETDSTQCYNCQTPLTPAEQKHPHYQPPHTCPHCHAISLQKQAAELGQLQKALDRVVSPLPGSVPWDNVRPLLISKKHDGRTLLEFLCDVFPSIPQVEWERRMATGRLRDPEDELVEPTRNLRAGERFRHIEPAQTEPPVNASVRLLYADEAILILDKPAPLPMHAGGRFNRNTLVHFLNTAFAPAHPRPAHRLDANTTGVVVCARTRHFAGLLQPQFERNEVEKIYLVAVHGIPASLKFECNASIAAEPSATGARGVGGPGAFPAITCFEVLKHDVQSNISLLLARPLTGRTNQIRVHLWDAGHPVAGDPLYLQDRLLGGVQTLTCDAPPMCLHAWQIRFRHPKSGAAVSFEAPPPAWGRISD